jgi:hypothetical protein
MQSKQQRETTTAPEDMCPDDNESLQEEERAKGNQIEDALESKLTSCWQLIAVLGSKYDGHILDFENSLDGLEVGITQAQHFILVLLKKIESPQSDEEMNLFPHLRKRQKRVNLLQE